MTKSLNAAVAKALGREKKDVDALLKGLASALCAHCAESQSVALPGFGVFTPVMHQEEVVIDRSTGRRMLLPPVVELTFCPATRLRNQIEKLQANDAENGERD
jgi:DNA-binding protein HU-beta/integration host factor subunit alpha